MDVVNRYRKFLLLGLVVLFLVGIVWYLKPETHAVSDVSRSNSTIQNQQSVNTVASVSDTNQQVLKFHGVMPELAPSLRGTEVNCPLQVDTKGQLVLSRGIRDCFDYFLSSIGEKTESSIVVDIRQYLAGLLPTTAQPYTYQLLDKYMDYLHQREKLPAAQTNSAKDFKTVASAIVKLRRQIFTPQEADVFFAQEESYDQYAIAQYAINNDKRLSTNQKAEKSAALLNEQPEELKASMQPILQYNQLQELTTEINQRGGSASELYEMRKKLVGAAAADRLTQVDLQESQWQKRVDSYLAARAQITASQQDATQQQAAINELRNKSFSSPEERIRAQTFEQIQANSNKKVAE